jgi:predicted dithiol-disulfide oxidoreductase (DUF899 family)
MTDHAVVGREEWAAARQELLVREKEHSRLGDELARHRRALPWVRVDEEYSLDTGEGSRTLLELFDDRSQLVVYHFMFGPNYASACPTCSSTADSFNGVLPHLAARDTTMICASRAPLEKLLGYRERMGWSFNWASSFESDFNIDFGVAAGEARHAVAPLLEANEIAILPLLSDPHFRDNLPPVVNQLAGAAGTDVVSYLSEGHGVSVFAREGDTIYHCYSSYARGTEFLMGYYAILDRVPKGRDEDDVGMGWLRRHDEYDG